jgi:hypothetical protein
LEVEGCEVPTVDRKMQKCLKCQTGYIFDSTTEACKEVVKKVDNCKDYDSNANCKICDTDFYLKDGDCAAVLAENKKKNCAVYNSDGTQCTVCSAGFYLNGSPATCVSIPKVDNCIAYTQNKCSQCDPGYIIDENYKLTLKMDNNFFQQIVKAKILGSGSTAFLYESKINNCKKTTVKNCAQFESFKKCSTCSEGFHLHDEGKKCTAYPEESITDCLIYSDASTCVECVNGTYKVGNECRTSTIVEFCEEYSKNSDECVSCQYTKYLKDGKCVQRSLIETSNQCKEFEKLEDKCATCNPNFILNNEKDKCLPNIPYCASPQVSALNMVTCTSCVDGYGLKEGACAVRNVKNCMRYDGLNAACAECDDGYYMEILGTLCSLNTVKNCSEKSKTLNECVKCDEHFYVDSEKNNTCSLQSVSDCKTFIENKNQCEECAEGFFQTLPDKTCEEYTLKNCETPEPNQNLCQTCNLNYFKDDNKAEGCSLQNFSNCTGYVANSPSCNDCEEGYFLVTDGKSGNVLCVMKDNKGCEEFTNSLENENCQTCMEGYWLDGVNCSKQEIDKCVKHTENVNMCEKCDNLYQVSGGTSCTSINVEGCQESNGVNSDCTLCDRDFYLDGTSCTRRTSSSNVDPLCTGNKNTTNDGTCSECPKGKISFKTNEFVWGSVAVPDVDMTHCISWAEASDECVLCEEGWGTTPGQPVCSVAHTTENCKQKNYENASEPLSTPGNCKVCKDGFYNNAFTCTRMTNRSSNCYEGQTNPNSDECFKCIENSTYTSTFQFSVCLRSPTPLVDKCMTYDTTTPSTCNACLYSGTAPSSCAIDDTQKVVYNNATIEDDNVVLDQTKETDSTNYTECANGDVLGINDLGEATCAVCPVAKPIKKVSVYESGSVKMAGSTFISNTAIGQRTKTIGSDAYNLVPFANLPGTGYQCDAFASLPTNQLINAKTPDAGIARMLSSVNRKQGVTQNSFHERILNASFVMAPMDFTNSGVNIGYVLELDNTIIPIACKKGYYPESYETAGWTSLLNGNSEISSASDIEENVLTACQAYTGTTEMRKKYEGLGYKSSSSIPLNVYIQFDSCVQDTDLFFFTGAIKVSVSELNNTSTVLHKGMDTTDHNQHCINKTSLSGEQHDFVENCQVHLNPSDNLSTLMATKSTFQCLSCKPGFAPIFDESLIAIEKCTPIANCNISNDATNTWMNMCQRCNEGFSWGLAQNDISVDLSSCVENTISNCEVVDTNNTTKCMLCEYGYQLENNRRECVKLEISNCTSYNFHPLNHLTLGAITNDAATLKKLRDLTAFLHWSALGERPQYMSGCNECSDGFSPHVDSEIIIKVCTGTLNVGEVLGDLIEHCEVYEPSNSNPRCGKCKDGFISYEKNGYTFCGPKNPDGSEDRCLKKFDDIMSDGTNCVQCEGFTDTYNFKCVDKSNCEDFDFNGCKRCKAGFKVDLTTKECRPIPLEDPCEMYVLFGNCIKCKDASKSPVNIVNSSDSSKIFSFCVDNYFDSDNDASHKNNNMFKGLSYKIDFDSGAKTYSSSSELLTTIHIPIPKSSENMNSTTMVPLHSVCLDIPELPNCKTPSEFLPYICDECEDGYHLNSTTFQCETHPVENCATYVPGSSDCDECIHGFFRESETKCTQRTVTNCQTFNKTNDTCQNCHPDHWALNVGYGYHCNPYTIENCATFESESDACASCHRNIRYLDSGECKLYTKQFCKEFSTTEDKCTECYSDRWLDDVKTFACKEYTVSNCAVYYTDNDACNGCDPFFYEEGLDCVPPKAELCDERNETVDQCDTCVDGAWKDGALCVLNTAQNCRGLSKTSNECVECLSAHYRNAQSGNSCVPHTADNCETFSPNSDSCLSCADNFYMDGDSRCVDNTSMHCDVKSKNDNVCITCEENYYLNGENQCSKVTNTTCKTVLPNSNNCDTCESTKYMHTQSGECVTYTPVDNCKTYKNNEDKCVDCSFGFYKTSDGQLCKPNPTGIAFCVSYSDLNTCSKCRNTHYLENNECHLLTQAVVQQCASYSGDGICSMCASGHSLDGSSCAPNVATGCTKWANKDTCETCPDNALMDNGNCTTTAITGCAKTSGTVGAEECLMCASGYYLKSDDKTCTATLTTIQYCEHYSGNNICGRCAGGYSVSADGSSCNAIDKSVFGPKCHSGTANATPICSICGDGFLMDDEGKCSVSCQSSSCFICDPNDLEKCLLCRTGYHMNDQMMCVKNGREENGENQLGVIGLLFLVGLVLRFDW